MRISIHDQREVARLHFYDCTQPSRSIGRAVGISAATVSTLRKHLKKFSGSWEELKALDDEGWKDVLGTHDKSIAKVKPHPDWNWVQEQLSRPNGTLEEIHLEWKEVQPDGIKYTQFVNLYREWNKRQSVVLRKRHIPGMNLFVDFAGSTVEIRDANGAPSSFAQVFVAVLGYSNYTFLYAVPTQTTSYWVECHVKCFEDLGGVPKYVVCDNLKAAVWRREKENIVINPGYRDCLSHFGTVAMPADPRKPKHKAKAEVGVQIAQRWVLFRLRDRTFFSVDELNSELKRHCSLLNQHPFKAMPGSRQQRFAEVEKELLKPLPSGTYEAADWRYNVLVGADYHFEHEGCYYSVPHWNMRERIDLKFTSQVIEAFRGGRRIAVHSLLKAKGNVSTMIEHQPVAHKSVLDGEPNALREWAAQVGGYTESVVLHHLEGRVDRINGLKAAQAMRKLSKIHGEERFEQVCKYASTLNITALRSLKSILATCVDQRREQPNVPPARITHENVRGPAYYKGIQS